MSKFNLMTLDTKLDLEMIHVEKPQQTEFSVKVLENDPWLIRRGCQVIGNVPKMGTFFLVEDPKDNYVYTIHESLIASMYDVKDFVIRRNYYLNSFVSSGGGTTQPPLAQRTGSSPAPKKVEKNESNLWSDLDESDAQETTSLQDKIAERGEETQNDNVEYVENVINSLCSRRWKRIPFCDLKEKDLIPIRDGISIIDYTCCFIDPREVIDQKIGNFSYNFFYKKLNEVNEWSGDLDSRPISIFGDTSGFSSMTRFHLQSMQGKDQYSFLRVLILFCLRSVTSFDEVIKDQKIKLDLKKFLTNIDEILYDCLKVVRVNFTALKNNQRVTIDTGHLKQMSLV